MRVLVVHGGCDEGSLSDEEKNARFAGVNEAFEEGLRVLRKTDSALDAVESSIRVLENNPHFDAGIHGSFNNMIGEIEMDAALMDSNESAGGVIRIRNFEHPISVARGVMEEMPHLMICGKGAEIFARLSGFKEISPDKQQGNVDKREIEKLPADLKKFIRKYKRKLDKQHYYSTVGAVAMDTKGYIVAGTSTGGIAQAFPGRVGDSAIIGAGTFATKLGGASATGIGEGIIRTGLTRKVLELVGNGLSVQESCDKVINFCTEAGFPCGVIVIDCYGNIGMAHNGFFMPVVSKVID
ncbi:MAG: isoaspartyl peptidase/L-asparaginase [Kosmotoga sp.]|nr:MAG: isoaspartyl peptidase/L-asparaginase [Kosmotoga sp.]